MFAHFLPLLMFVISISSRRTRERRRKVNDWSVKAVPQLESLCKRPVHTKFDRFWTFRKRRLVILTSKLVAETRKVEIWISNAELQKSIAAAAIERPSWIDIREITTESKKLIFQFDLFSLSPSFLDFRWHVLIPIALFSSTCYSSQTTRW